MSGDRRNTSSRIPGHHLLEKELIEANKVIYAGESDKCDVTMLEDVRLLQYM